MRPIHPITALLLILAALGPGAAHGQQPAGPRDLPNPQATPGDVTGATREQLCAPGYVPSLPPVTAQAQALVFQAYGLNGAAPGTYQLDHLVPLSLGGSNAIANLWPLAVDAQPYNVDVKRRLEQRLLQMVCSGQLTLAAAQRAMASDWVSAYWNYVGE
jgi:hypothetical protein